MSYKDLEERDVFLPASLWGKADLHTSVNQLALIAAGAAAILSCVLMVLGNGACLTWVGVGLFLVFIVAFALISNAGIEKQNEKIEQLIEQHR